MVLTLGLVPATPVLANPGIVSIWHFDGNADDSSGNGNDGTEQGDATYAAGMFGQALSLDGNGDYVTVVENGSLDITTAITIEAWIKTTQTTRGEIVSKYDAHWSERSYVFDIGHPDAGSGKVALTISSTKAPYTGFLMPSTITVNDGEWHHVVAVFDPGVYAKIFVDGIDRSGTIVGTLQSSIAVSARNLAIGAGYSASTTPDDFFFNGLIDEVRIWDSATLGYTVAATLETDVNPVMTDHTITATIDPVAPGVTVNFDIITGPNVGDSGNAVTNSSGIATWTYTGDGGGGTDTIRVWVDLNWNGSYDADVDADDEVTKDWVVNFVTGGANIKVGKPVTWTFGGTVGYLPDMTRVGQFQIVDHAGKVAYHLNSFSSLIFSGGATGSPPASYNIATFNGSGWDNNGNTITDVIVVIQDLGEPGAGTDNISLSVGLTLGNTVISGGNFQVHDLE